MPSATCMARSAGFPSSMSSETLAEARSGRTFVHPFKALDELAGIGQALGLGENSSSAARSG